MKLKRIGQAGYVLTGLCIATGIVLYFLDYSWHFNFVMLIGAVLLTLSSIITIIASLMEIDRIQKTKPVEEAPEHRVELLQVADELHAGRLSGRARELDADANPAASDTSASEKEAGGETAAPCGGLSEKEAGSEAGMPAAPADSAPPSSDQRR
ncbi:MAG: hypothetical protein MSH10_03635 [Pygmaiobacter massiliensis]|nr:hypothetical protein [Pygmaiobacter massiliensis]